MADAVSVTSRENVPSSFVYVPLFAPTSTTERYPTGAPSDSDVTMPEMCFCANVVIEKKENKKKRYIFYNANVHFFTEKIRFLVKYKDKHRILHVSILLKTRTYYFTIMI